MPVLTEAEIATLTAQREALAAQLLAIDAQAVDTLAAFAGDAQTFLTDMATIKDLVTDEDVQKGIAAIEISIRQLIKIINRKAGALSSPSPEI